MPGWISKLAQIASAVAPMAQRMARRIRARRKAKASAIDDLRRKELETPKKVRGRGN